MILYFVKVLVIVKNNLSNIASILVEYVKGYEGIET